MTLGRGPVVAFVLVFMGTVAARGLCAPLRLRASAPSGLPAQESNPARDQLFDQVMAEPPKNPVSPEEGRGVFDKLCAQCHKFGAIGKEVGPDLTTMTSR